MSKEIAYPHLEPRLDSSFMVARRGDALNGHDRWDIYNAKSHDGLGVIFWYPAWRQFVFAPEGTPVFSHDCMTALSTFCRFRTQEAKE